MKKVVEVVKKEMDSVLYLTIGAGICLALWLFTCLTVAVLG